ncbi:MAG: hypothetical protein BWY24_00539 [Microgenomates group bacterium ADurb.Bin219]|nr:MAG: hypothetical protein BWY24_00539 [Microgenomates group bacterium ADurb.Bin219]HNP89627.1 hypothetical protein [Candidatus Woesebacteria bacterium]
MNNLDSADKIMVIITVSLFLRILVISFLEEFIGEDLSTLLYPILWLVSFWLIIIIPGPANLDFDKIIVTFIVWLVIYWGAPFVFPA